MKAVFTARRVSSYDDDVSFRYHFPRTYLGQAEQALQLSGVSAYETDSAN